MFNKQKVVNRNYDLKWYYFAFAIFSALSVLTTHLYVDDQNRFKLIPMRMGDFYHQQNVVFSDESNDILALGSSTAWQSFDPIALQTYFREQGREINVALMASNWRGEDLIYQQLKLYLKYKKPKLVLISTPSGSSISPHPASKYLTNIFLEWDTLKALSTNNLLTSIAEALISIPKLLFSSVLFESRLENPRFKRTLIQENNGYLRKDLHYRKYGDDGFKLPFTKELAKPPKLIAQNIVLKANSKNEWFETTRKPADLNNFESIYWTKLIKLAKDHKLKLVLLQFPYPELDKSEKVQIRKGVYGLGLDIIGVPMDVLYPGWGRNRILNQFENGTHMNSNGGPYHTLAIAPAIFEIFTGEVL